MTLSRIGKRSFAIGFAAAYALATASVAQASTVTNIDLSAYYNGSWSNEINGSALQTGAESGTGNAGTGLTFSDPNGQFFSMSGGTSGSISFSPISLNANAVVNSLMNEFFGIGAGNTAAVITFTNNLSQTAQFNIVEGQTVRDYNNDGWTNTLTGTGVGVTAQPWWTTQDAASNGNGQPSQRLDAQTFYLPASWAGTDLISAAASITAGSPFDVVLSALQVDDRPLSTTPLPESLPLFLSGLGAFGLIWRRRKRKTAAGPSAA